MQQDADEQPLETAKAKKGGKEGVEQEMPQPLERLPVAVRNLFAAPIEGICARDVERRRE